MVCVNLGFAASSPAIRQRNQIYAENIHKRGNVKSTLKPEKQKYPVGPILLGFIVFVVVGGAVFDILSRLLK
ncbi:stress-associated endoplasmic reticulum protein [Cladochytrium replicatum]|nr:stress-associated endoplasmic reticulum protein [Cladochytrium replicatum]